MTRMTRKVERAERLERLMEQIYEALDEIREVTEGDEKVYRTIIANIDVALENRDGWLSCDYNLRQYIDEEIMGDSDEDEEIVGDSDEGDGDEDAD